MVWYNFGSKKISKSKIHILTISGQMLLKPAIANYTLEEGQKMEQTDKTDRQ